MSEPCPRIFVTGQRPLRTHVAGSNAVGSSVGDMVGGCSAQTAIHKHASICKINSFPGSVHYFELLEIYIAYIVSIRLESNLDS